MPRATHALHPPQDAEHHLSAVDPVMARIIQAIGPCALRPKRRSPYEALLQAIVYQQLNGRAAATILGRVKRLFPKSRFPSPAALLSMPDERLRGAGLSRAKLASLKDLAAKTESGLVPSTRAIATLDNDEIMRRLTEIRGVGPWTVEMLLIFTLGRTDVLPVTDYGVRKGFALAYGMDVLPLPKELSKAGEIWSPFRSVAAWYLWRILDAKPAVKES